MSEGNVYSAYHVIKGSLQSKQEQLLYTNNLESPGIYWMVTKGKHLYFFNHGYTGDTSKDFNSSNRILQYVNYDLENNTFTQTDMNPENGEAGSPALLDNAMVFCKYNYSYTDERNRDLFQRDLNGENEKKIYTIEPTGCTVQWDGTYYYVDNYIIILGQPENASLLRQIWVYDKDFNHVTTFDLTDVDGNNLSKTTLRSFFISDDMLFTSEDSSSRNVSSFIYIDKSELASGKVSPHKVTF